MKKSIIMSFLLFSLVLVGCSGNPGNSSASESLSEFESTESVFESDTNGESEESDSESQ